MNYYRYEGHTLCAWEALPYERIGALPGRERSFSSLPGKCSRAGRAFP